MLAFGTKLGPYEIVATLGKGGMGEVFRARDTRLDRDVAIKVLPEDFSNNLDALRRFQREAKSLAALSHPNIVAIFDVGVEQAITYVVMELLEGEVLRNKITKTGVSWKQALQIAIPVAEGLAAAHSKGLIHRDLKPENIFITQEHRVKILDFGLARRQPPAANLADATQAPTAELQSEIIAGTVPYMAPEQLRGGLMDARTDIFAIGCVLYEMLCGSRPFSGTTSSQIIASILTDDPPAMKSASSEIPPELQRVVSRCLEKDPARRFQSAADLTFALREIGSGSASQPTVFSQPSKISKLAIVFAVAVLITVIGGAFLMKNWKKQQTIASIAVLPFENASPDSSAEYLSDGITETLINNLSSVTGLRVMARTTVFAYKHKNVSPQQVASELKVASVLTGKIAERDDRLIVQVDLVSGDGSEIWGSQYQRPVKDIFALQDDIAHSISDGLRLKLTPEQKGNLTKSYTENREAYELYLKGLYHWNKRKADSLRQAIDYFQQAIDLDPTYALAYAGLAQSYTVLQGYDILAPSEARPKALAAARKALEIDNSIAEAHATLGASELQYQLNWTESAKEYERAIALNPNFATAYQWYSENFIAQKRFDEALKLARKAQEVDPLSRAAITALGHVYLYQGDWEEAQKQYSKALEMDSDFPPALRGMGAVYEHQGHLNQAVSQFRRQVAISDTPANEALLASALARMGNPDESRKILMRLNERAGKEYVSPLRIASVYAALGDREAALQLLQKAEKEHANYFIYLDVDPAWNSLRSDPRFQALLRDLHIPR